MKNPVFSSDSIILTKKKFGDGHMHYSLLTKELGFIKACAFGGSRLSKRFKGGLDYFQILDAEIQTRTYDNAQSFDLVSIKSIKHRFSKITNDLEKYICAAYVLELSSMILTPMETTGRGHRNYFDVLANCLDNIDSSINKNQAVEEAYRYSMGIYQDTGFTPDLMHTDTINSKLQQIEHFNSRILERTPKSFAMLCKIYINQL